MRRALLITAVANAESMLISILRRIQYDRGGDARWGSLVNSPSLEAQVRRLTRGASTIGCPAFSTTWTLT